MDVPGTGFDLGFTDQEFQAGVHICQIFTSDEERFEVLSKYMAAGCVHGERVACFSAKTGPDQMHSFLESQGISCNCDRAMHFSDVDPVYFKDGAFDPDRMLGMLEAFYADALKEGFGSARVVGEMSTRVLAVAGGERLLEYESRVSMLQKKVPVTTVCQYDARVFDGATIMDIMKVHPYLVVRGGVVRNPFFIPPEQFLAMNG